MPTLTIEPEKIYELVDQLDTKNKMEVFKRLKPQVLTTRWERLFARIDKKTTRYPITEEEINEEVERAREEIASRRS